MYPGSRRDRSGVFGPFQCVLVVGSFECVRSIPVRPGALGSFWSIAVGPGCRRVRIKSIPVRPGVLSVS